MEGAKNSALKLVQDLLDSKSFMEIGADISLKNTDFNLHKEAVSGDGVVTGYGLIDGNPVFLYAQDGDVLGGSIGEMHANKIVELYDRALKMGAPIIGIINSSGLRILEGMDSLSALGKLFLKMNEAEGRIPQINIVEGTALGASAILANMADIVLMNKVSGKLAVISPNAIVGNHIDKLDTSSFDYRSKEACDVDIGYENQSELRDILKKLINILPANSLDRRIEKSQDLPNRLMSRLTPDSPVRDCIIDLVDNNSLIELKKDSCGMITSLAKLNGITVGIIANDYNDKEALLSSDGLIKASHFVKFLDVFNIPIITISGATGFDNSFDNIKHLARNTAILANSFAEASVPKINLIIRSTYGTPYIVMNSKSLGCDMTYALENAKIGVFSEKNSLRIMFNEDSLEEQRVKLDSLPQLKVDARNASSRGYVDSIIDASSARIYIISALEMLLSKRSQLPNKRHTTL